MSTSIKLKLSTKTRIQWHSNRNPTGCKSTLDRACLIGWLHLYLHKDNGHDVDSQKDNTFQHHSIRLLTTRNYL